ncbi:Peroxidase [Geosmithia morbida]|uniref:Peroxidase n=1 Tax=Geosmithia morbida TaxID=1094350 RepID=A0A9P5D2L7_9HYPO|nr:Peroxidase [Geosmithia morbida]KAF4119629.1 Peroxidase [Geosmithia morbida]
MRGAPFIALAGMLIGSAWADPTWPAEIDELEEIMFQLESFSARKFADTVSPCSNEASGPGRINAAEWLRTAFHDMSTASVYFGTGGLDGSLQYELTNTENLGPGLTTTIEFMGPYISRKSSLADLLALGVYMSVRSCGGPAVPIRAGRIDATVKGNTGVPQPQNSAYTLQQQFDRMGFTNEEMIQVTACGHTLGGVHSDEFPDIVTEGTGTDDQIGLDDTAAVFDNAIVTEYLNGSTTNPLVVGPSVKVSKNSDFKVFDSDGNKTMQALADAATFRSTCKAVLQKMIEVVPPGVNLTDDPITAYAVKPVDMQLTLTAGGKSFLWTGFIRVKTTGLADDTIDSVQITYKNREGTCNTSSCTVSATVQGLGRGFDDTFAYFPIEATISASTGISSFTVTVKYTDGTTEDYDNNGESYPLQDGILIQKPQSCLLSSSGDVTLIAAVRNDLVGSDDASAFISYKTAQTTSPVPRVQNKTINLEAGDCVGEYTFFTANWTIPGGLASQSYIDVQVGEYVDEFKGAGGQTSGTPSPTSGSVTTTTTKASVEPSSGTTTKMSLTASPETTTRSTSTSTASTTSSTLASSTETATSTTIATSAAPAPSHIDEVGNYTLVGCWGEPANGRALSQKTTSDDSMTNALCAASCSGFRYFATEYSHECYCGSYLSSSSAAAPLSDCSMTCSGDDASFCGGPSRLELFMDPDIDGGDPEQPAAAGDFVWLGCHTEGDGVRALSGAVNTGDDMTNEACADFCDEYEYFGTEYGRECYCGDELGKGVEEVDDDGECGALCAGDVKEFCGGSNRLSVYRRMETAVLDIVGDEE